MYSVQLLLKNIATAGRRPVWFAVSSDGRMSIVAAANKRVVLSAHVVNDIRISPRCLAVTSHNSAVFSLLQTSSPQYV